MTDKHQTMPVIIAVDHAYTHGDRTAYLCRCCGYFAGSLEKTKAHKCFEPVMGGPAGILFSKKLTLDEALKEFPNG